MHQLSFPCGQNPRVSSKFRGLHSESSRENISLEEVFAGNGHTSVVTNSKTFLSSTESLLRRQRYLLYSTYHRTSIAVPIQTEISLYLLQISLKTFPVAEPMDRFRSCIILLLFVSIVQHPLPLDLDRRRSD